MKETSMNNGGFNISSDYQTPKVFRDRVNTSQGFRSTISQSIVLSKKDDILRNTNTQM